MASAALDALQHRMLQQEAVRQCTSVLQQQQMKQREQRRRSRLLPSNKTIEQHHPQQQQQQQPKQDKAGGVILLGFQPAVRPRIHTDIYGGVPFCLELPLMLLLLLSLLLTLLLFLLLLPLLLLLLRLQNAVPAGSCKCGPSSPAFFTSPGILGAEAEKGRAAAAQ